MASDEMTMRLSIGGQDRDRRDPKRFVGAWVLVYEAVRKDRSAKAMIVNLNKFRKQRARTEAERRAAENRIRFGRSKATRSKDLREREQAEKTIEDKRLD